MKPITKKTAGNKPAKPAEVPVESTAETEAHTAGDELDETSDQDPPEEEVTEEVDQGAQDPNPVQPEVQEQTPPEPAKSGNTAEEVMLGVVPAKLIRMPLSVVEQALINDHQVRIGILRNDRSIRELQDRMRDTDGRCAPVIFTYRPEDKTVPPALFSGIESIAAAMNLELPELSVLLVSNADAYNAQGFLTAKMREKPKSSEDDFLQRVQSYFD